MISLQFYKPEDFSELNYVLNEIQLQNTMTVDGALKRTKQREKKNDFSGYPVTIFLDKKAVGFFILDFGEDKWSLSENANAVLLRSLSINPEFQGKGIGRSAMLLVVEFVQDNFSKVNEIVLAVNKKNEAAHQLYLACGFQYCGITRIGRNGLQYILSSKF